MPQSYKSLSGECVTRKEIEKSRFIATSRHVSGEEEARAFIEETAKRYPGATHNCFAYIGDRLGNFPRFSDDGEPQGTAGMPILEVLKSNGLCEACVVVTRYFGGIKLGAGGLVRAYSGAAAENIASARKVMYEMCAESAYTVGYSQAAAASRFFAESGADVVSAEYSDDVRFVVAVKKAEEEKFVSSLLNALNGRVKIEKSREYFFPFKI